VRPSAKIFRSVLAAALALLAHEAQAQTLAEAKCTGKPDVPWTEQIAGCSTAIESGKYTGKDLARAFTFRANAFSQTGELDRALADIERAIQLDPTDAFAYGGRGDLYLVKKDYERAIADYSKMIAMEPANALPLIGRGMAYWLEGELDRATVEFEQAVKLQPAAALPLYWRGMARRARGDVAGGEADIAAAKKIDPAVDR
jgi:tetratricopeptide (TPR) repeat protein